MNHIHIHHSQARPGRGLAEGSPRQSLDGLVTVITATPTFELESCLYNFKAKLISNPSNSRLELRERLYMVALVMAEMSIQDELSGVTHVPIRIGTENADKEKLVVASCDKLAPAWPSDKDWLC